MLGFAGYPQYMYDRPNSNEHKKKPQIYIYGNRVITDDANGNKIEICSDLSSNNLMSDEPEHIGRSAKSKPRTKMFRIEYISAYPKRKATFMKRKKGLMKKSKELSILTGASVLCVVISERNEVAMYTSDRMRSVGDELQRLLQEHFMTIFNFDS